MRRNVSIASPDGIGGLSGSANPATARAAAVNFRLSGSDQKSKGLGWSLMEIIIDYARKERLRRIEGQILAENSTMLTMCQELGFHAVDDRGRRASSSCGLISEGF